MTKKRIANSPSERFIQAGRKQKTSSQGFTLVEVMISMMIFTVLVTVGITAVLGAIKQHKTSQNARTVMDSLNFIMEDMTRNLRLASNVRCEAPFDTDAFDPSAPYAVISENCIEGSNRIFFNDAQFNHVVYYINPVTHQIEKKIGDSGVSQVISPPGVVIDPSSDFIVRGALPTSSFLGSGTDTSQPTVAIHLNGTVTYQGINTKFSLQTLVALRYLDY